MPRLTPENLLATALDRLCSERAKLVSRVAEIDASFERLGITIASAAPAPVKSGKRRGRPPGSKNAKAAKPAKSTKAAKAPKTKKRKRRTFAITGDESILAFVKAAGQPNAAEINAHWKKEGRSGVCNTPITNLVKAGKLTRVEVKDERGSRYKLA